MQQHVFPSEKEIACVGTCEHGLARANAGFSS